MANKLISTLLSIAVLIGIVPAMSVMASGGTTYTVDNFESYEAQVYTSAHSPLSVDGTGKWVINENVKVEVFATTGYDNTSTKALKYINTAGRSTDISSGAHRFTAQKSPSHTTALEDLAGNIFVEEVDFWLPADVTLDSGVDYKRPYKVNLGYGVCVVGSKLYVYEGKIDTQFNVNSETWYRIKTTFDYSQYNASGDPVTFTVYANNTPIFSKTYTDSGLAPAKHMGYFAIMASASSSKQEDALGGFNDVYFVMDNLHMYSNPETTIASSIYDGAGDVSLNPKLTVDFSEQILASVPGAVNGFDQTLKIAKSYDTDVVFAKVTAANDYKSVIIEPETNLEYDTTYTVTIKDFKDCYGCVVPSFTFSFTTKSQPAFTLSSPKFTKEEIGVMGGASSEITALENGDICVSYSVSNNKSETKEVLMFAVLRESGKLKNIQFKQLSVSSLETAFFNAGFEVDNYENQAIEIYVWDSFVNKAALTSSYTISANGITTTASE